MRLVTIDNRAFIGFVNLMGGDLFAFIGSTLLRSTANGNREKRTHCGLCYCLSMVRTGRCNTVVFVTVCQWLEQEAVTRLFC